jgi:hypothetical protein
MFGEPNWEPDLSDIRPIPENNTQSNKKRDGQPGQDRSQDNFQQNRGKYKPARRGWRVALKWQWSTRRCNDCGEVKYHWRTLRWSYSRKRPDGSRETYRKPVPLNELRKGTKVPAPGPGPVIKCVCPGKRGPRPSTLGQK